MSHHCHATGCTVEVPPKMFMCRRHWFSLPRQLRLRIWGAYLPGQEENWQISHEYAEVAREAVRYVAARERRTADTSVYDMLDPGDGPPEAGGAET